MNIVPNSDSELCTESRLGQVHSVHTPMASAARTLLTGPAVSWRNRRRVTGLPRLYRGLPLGRVAACTGRVASHVACCAALCIASRLPMLLLVMSQASLTVSRARPAVSWLCPAVSRPPFDAPRPACLISLLCAYSACCVPTQPAVCLLSDELKSHLFLVHFSV